MELEMQITINQVEDITIVLAKMEGKNYIGPWGKVIVMYGIARSEYERGVRFINVYSDKTIKFACTKNKVKQISADNFLAIK